MKVSIKVSIGLLLSLFAYTMPANAQPTITPADGNTYNLSIDLTENVSMDIGGAYSIDITDGSTLTGDISKLGTPGTLAVSMDSASEVVGTVSADGVDNVVSVTGGTVTAGTGKDTLNVENDGAIILTGTTANDNGGNLIFTATGGTVTATNSKLSGDITHEGDDALTVEMNTNSTLTGKLINTTGTGALNVNMTGGSSITGSAESNGNDAAGSNVINIMGGTIEAAASENTLTVENLGRINLTGTTANDNGANLIYSASGGTVNASGSTLSGDINHEGAATLTVTLGDGSAGSESTLSGDIVNGTAAGGIVDLTIATGSTFAGAASTNADRHTNITVEELWTVTGDSSLGLGNLDNAGTVDFKTNTAYMTVSAGDLGLNGATDGIFAMKMDIVAQEHDTLEIANTAAGSYTITAQSNDASAATSGKELFNLVEIEGTSTATFALDNPNDIELGAWMYSLRETAFGSGTAWQVYSTGLSNAGSAAVNTVAAAYLMGYAEMNTLTQRLGDLRETRHMSGFWARVHGGKFSTDGMRFGKDFDLKYGGIQIGYDQKLIHEWDGDIHLGVMFGYSNGDIDFDYAGGGGDIDSKTFGVYGTYKGADGFYIDAVLKYQWMEHGFNTFDSQGAKVTTNDIETSGFGASIEAGKRFELKNSWYVEPQAQLSYLKQDGGTYRMSNGLRMRADGWTSLLGRIGARVGYECGAHNFYAKLSLVKEFDGDIHFKANGVGFKDSLSDSWWVYGVGYTTKLNDRNDLYFDLERATGGVFDQDWSVRAGWRITF